MSPKQTRKIHRSADTGKFVPESEGGRFAEVIADATIAWPIILKAVMERMEKK